MVDKINIHSVTKEEVGPGVRCCVLFGSGMSFACFEDDGINPPSSVDFSHTEEQATMLLKGRAIYWVEGKPIHMEPGDLVFVPPHTKHHSEVVEGPALFIFFYQPPFDPRTEHKKN